MRIKLNHSIRLDVSVMGSKANALNEGYTVVTAGEISGLETVEKYINEDKKIKELIELYVTLVKKDVNDINEMLEKYTELDALLGKKIGNPIGGGGGSAW